MGEHPVKDHLNLDEYFLRLGSQTIVIFHM